MPSFTECLQSQGSLNEEIISFVNNTISKVQKKCTFISLILKQFDLKVSELFQGTINIYGSYATGLAIDSSDIDIAVTNVKFHNREELQQACIKLEAAISPLPFVLSCQKIITATIPVVKLEVDLLYFSGFSSKVNIDITFVDFAEGCHFGLEAISFTRDLLILFPHIQYITIVLKHFLYTHKLNSVYHGNF